MCGIALIVSGIHFDPACSAPETQPLLLSLDDLKEALRRRGPHSLGSKRLLLHSNSSNLINKQEIVTSIEEEVTIDTENSYSAKEIFSSSFQNGENPVEDKTFGIHSFVGELLFLGATLQLRGVSPIVQPLVDKFGNILVYNGEIFGGIPVGCDENDAEILSQYLARCCFGSSHGDNCSCCCSGNEEDSVPDVLSRIKGPWAIVYWQNSSRTLWFGRDAFGRRSLLVHWPTEKDPRFLLSSVAPTLVEHSSDLQFENGVNQQKYWEELTCGIYSVKIDASILNGCLIGDIRSHEWNNSMVKKLIHWERTHVEPTAEELYLSQGFGKASPSVPAETVLTALRESVLRRTCHKFFQSTACNFRERFSPVAVLFSGGLDSMIIAAILDQCIDPRFDIDLLNVSFDGPSAPDRISARAGKKELRRIAPSRRWRLVEIDADLSNLSSETKHVMSLIHPANTYMDLNIGIALWLAASGDGWVCEERDNENDEDLQLHNYRSNARIVLVGSGADEQCAGYGRHKTKYKHGSWLGLDEEMRLDMQRIWKRNLGRDDRCIADHGKEARFPFLDEDVIKVLLDIPLWEIADLEQPSGTGDKKILREVARLLGLHEASALPKRAIQFGSRIARESNRKNFGSNRAANQASAGSVVIHMP
ncbi:asparagine synthetase domain-containing protein 1 isoform X2 [Rhodamnia argentea]|uniref:Asparagine synthetase domain-containing protein 1 isoform X2 n=1 Tax=Rhodamnia argentea TaxID=178133 RepID=A0A8B8QL68_9MYRT|nr:asparagine synthetase domain-containing protein 1 isoform X2 [Rhodamnia argentea]